MEAVHVLVRIDRLDGRLRGDVGGQRQLHQDAVDRRIGVQASDLGDQRFLGRIGRQADRVRRDPDGTGRAILGAHIDRARRIVAHQHHRKAGSERQRGDLLGEPRPQCRSDRLAVDDARAHSAASFAPSAAGSPATCSVFSRLVAPSVETHRGRRQSECIGKCRTGGAVGAAVFRGLGDADAQPLTVG